MRRKIEFSTNPIRPSESQCPGQSQRAFASALRETRGSAFAQLTRDTHKRGSFRKMCVRGPREARCLAFHSQSTTGNLPTHPNKSPSRSVWCCVAHCPMLRSARWPLSRSLRSPHSSRGNFRGFSPSNF